MRLLPGVGGLDRCRCVESYPAAARDVALLDAACLVALAILSSSRSNESRRSAGETNDGCRCSLRCVPPRSRTATQRTRDGSDGEEPKPIAHPEAGTKAPVSWGHHVQNWIP